MEPFMNSVRAACAVLKQMCEVQCSLAGVSRAKGPIELMQAVDNHREQVQALSDAFCTYRRELSEAYRIATGDRS